MENQVREKGRRWYEGEGKSRSSMYTQGEKHDDGRNMELDGPRGCRRCKTERRGHGTEMRRSRTEAEWSRERTELV